FFFTGTGPDGVSINPNLSQDNIPEDVQDWSFQAFLNSDHAASIDWCKTNLAVTDTPQTYNSDLVPMLNNNNLTGNIRVSGVTFATRSMRPPLAENENDPRNANVAGEIVVVQQDRKSTRLNSSHGSISYAVFCL